MKTIRFSKGSYSGKIAWFMISTPPGGHVLRNVDNLDSWTVKLNNGVTIKLDTSHKDHGLAECEDKHERIVRLMVELYEAVYVEGQR